MSMDSRSMDEAQSLQNTVIQIAAILERLGARSEQATRQMETGAATLGQSAQRLNESGEHLANGALRTIGAQARQTLSQSVSQVAGEFRDQMQQSVNLAKWAADALAEQRRQLSAAQSALVWKGLIALGIGSLLAAGGCGFYAWHSLREVKQYEFAKDIMRASQTGVLTPCGDGALCVKLGSKPKRAGKDGEYAVLVE